MGGQSQEARYLQQEQQQPDSVLQSQESPSSFYHHPHTMVMLPLLPWQPLNLHTFWDSCGQPQSSKHPPHRCLTCQSPDLSAEGHLFQHTLNLVSPCDRQLAAGIPQQRSYAPHTHTCRWIVWARAAQMPTTRVEQACSTSASTEQAPALLRSPGPLTEPAEGPHGPGPPHITPMTAPGQAVGGPAGDGAALGAPAEMEGGCAGMQHGSEDGTQPLPLGLSGHGTTGHATHPQHGSPRPRHLP